MQTQRNVVYERDETRSPRLSGMKPQQEDALSIVKLRRETTFTSLQAAEAGSPSQRRDCWTAAALPTYLTPLLGREQDVQTVAVLLGRPEVLSDN